ncbi:hypothetical protein Pan216_01330 [Planctomycetes bacterium Pan216]|uniref:Poly-gamma-glutamate system protein n=1 Tax=Kolteria novifilia TaxID=2527975 RepID=A0A518AX47_9BACT|nr:hypothetical protein Pan216_01330 [Planctomycetes bacterium Pan216]
MRRLYWRPRAVSQSVLVLICIFSLGGLLAVRSFETTVKTPYFDKKIAAAELARDAMDAIKQERLRRGFSIDPSIDPSRSGMIGEAMSDVTSVPGHLPSKQTSINPNFAAVVVDMLTRAGVREGDFVAVGFSGSFPALNTCVLAALKTLNLQPVIISSASASQFGANMNDFIWLEMERVLYEREIMPFRSAAASLGGMDDEGGGLSEGGAKILKNHILENQIPLIEPNSFTESLDSRMNIYRERSGEDNIAAYINVGGGTVSVGRSAGKKAFRPGLNMGASHHALSIDSVMSRFARNGIPIVHMSSVMDIAEDYGLPPIPTQLPEPGEGGVYVRREPSKLFALAVLAAIFFSLYVFVLSDLGFRILTTSSRKKEMSSPEPMI